MRPVRRSRKKYASVVEDERTILPDAMRAILTTTIGSLVLPVVVFSKGAIKLKLWSTVNELNRDKWEKCRGHATELTCAAVVVSSRSTET